jgi:hypothetical protein
MCIHSKDISFAPKKNFRTKQPLAVTHPHLLDEWDWEKNAKLGLNPYKLTYGSHKEAYWIDNFKHKWVARISNRTFCGNGCIYCSNQKAGYGNDLVTNFPELCEEWHPTKNISGPENYTKGSGKKVWWLCKVCGHEWLSTIANRTSHGKGCACCGGGLAHDNDNLLRKRPDVVLEWDYIKNLKGPEKYKEFSNKIVWWVCKKCGFSYKQKISTKSLGKCSCKECSDLHKSHLSQEWLDKLSIKIREEKICKYKVDGFDPATNTIYEFLGDYWHGNPSLYNGRLKNTKVGETFGQLYNQTFTRFEKLKQAGYNIVYIWENDYKAGKEAISHG